LRQISSCSCCLQIQLALIKPGLLLLLLALPQHSLVLFSCPSKTLGPAAGP
jgi:hypothetical protein